MAPRRPPSRPADPGSLLANAHPVGDLSVRLRLTRPSDAQRVSGFLDRLSPEALRRRFFIPVAGAAPTLVRHFTFYDPRRRFAVAATAPIDGTEEIVGLADVALLSTGLAELAVVVGDERQGQGVGGLLIEAVASLARQRGATHVKAELLEQNTPMLKLMQRLGPTVQTMEGGNPVVYTRLPAGASRAA